MSQEVFGVLFDVDGVLVDSYAAHLKTWQICCRKIGRNCTEEEFLVGFGRTSREFIREPCVNPPSDAQIKAFDEMKEALYRDVITAAFPAMPGAKELIEALAAAGVPMAIGSSAPPDNVRVVIEKLQVGDLIHTIITGADVVVGKPDPDVFLQGAKGIGVPPSRCIVLEDAPAGIQAGLAAGAKCVGVVSRGRTPEQLHQADHLVTDLTELSPEILRRIIDGVAL